MAQVSEYGGMHGFREVWHAKSLHQGDDAICTGFRSFWIQMVGTGITIGSSRCSTQQTLMQSPRSGYLKGELRIY